VATLVLAVLAATVAMLLALRPDRPRALLVGGAAVVGVGLALLLLCWIQSSFGSLVTQPLPAPTGGWAAAWSAGWAFCALGVLVTAAGLVRNRRAPR
jgi:hypothetical protein